MITPTQFNSSIEQLRPFERAPVVAVAVSGGADSIALVHLAHQWASNRNGKVIALTVDHQFREESASEAQEVKQHMQLLGIEHHTLTNQQPKPSSNVMENARMLRYKLLTDWCNAHHILHLLVGHHANDQIETLLMNLERGSGVDGLAAIAPCSFNNGVRILRPLLHYTKQQLTQYLESESIQWIEDPTNADRRYTRNALRASLETIQGDDLLLSSRLLNTTNSMARVRNALEHDSATAMANNLMISSLGYSTISPEDLFILPEEIQLRLLCNVLNTISGNTQRPRMEKLLHLLQSLKSIESFKGATLHGCKIIYNSGKITFLRELHAIEKHTPLSGSTLFWDSRFTISYEGNGYVSPLTTHDLAEIETKVSTSHIPKAVLLTLPALKNKYSEGVEELLCVPHINYYTDKCSETAINCYFSPPKALAAQPFGCYVQA